MLLGFSLVVVSCVTVYDTISNRDFSSHYNPGQTQIHPEFSVFMPSSTELRLYFRFFPWELAYKPDPKDSIAKAHVQLFFRVTKTYNSIEIIDSLTTMFHFKGKPRSQYVGFVPIRLLEKGKYVMEVFLTDINSQVQISKVMELDFQPDGNANSYMMLSVHGNPLFQPHFSVNDSFRIRSGILNPKGMKVEYYRPDTLLPEPPDQIGEEVLEGGQADSSWVLTNPDTVLFTFNQPGLYCFKATESVIGKPYLGTGIHFPYIKTPEDMLRPLGYLCSSKEMEVYWNLNNPKQAVDSFWISTAGDLDKARELIRVYYNRVQLANYFFTGTKEGWLTDKGMVYTICGPPAKVQLTDQGEYWVYGKGKKEAIEFYFYYDYHPLFGKLSILERSDLYSRMWYNAIATWREGRIFSLNP